MKKTVTILAVLLTAQLLLAVGMGLSDRSLSAGTEPVALLGFDANSVDRIALEGPDDAKVVLARSGSSWVLPDADQFPANSQKVQQLFERLASLKSTAPVAASASARERFKVSDEQFERRITLSKGNDTLARLYLGSSPGMRLIHARNEASDAIHAVKMAAYDVPVKASDWEDKSVLTLSKTAINAIDVNGLHIKRSASGTDSDKANGDSKQSPAWQAEGMTEGQQLKTDAVDKLAGLLADLQFEKVLGQEAKDEYGLAEPVLELSLSLDDMARDDNETLGYRLGKTRDKEEYTLKVSNRPEYFRLASYKAKPLIESASPEKLTEPVPDAADKAESAEGVEKTDTEEKAAIHDIGAEGRAPEQSPES
ncbi:MAG: DUF4340 domain-containing protein [Candidatus Thiodiazotropha taylori]|nr:DUF4340 domain-containing protein [Candidatus Thiodiazotropha taylori]